MSKCIEGDLVKENYQLKGKIISKFDHVINIKTDYNKGYAITDFNIANAPYHIKIDNKKFTQLSKNTKTEDNIYITANYIKTKKIKITTTNRDIYLGKLNKNTNINLTRIINITEKVIKNIQNNDSLGTTILSFEKIIKNFDKFELTPLQKYFYEILKGVLYENSSIKPLIGLGIGLTPSGDDFVVGYLSAVEAKLVTDKLNIKEELKNIDLFKQTTRVSALHLKAALSDRYNEKLYNLYKNISYKDSIYIRYSKELLDTGSSSGLDMFSGVYFALSI